MKIMQVVGTRPNFMKAAPIIRELSSKGLNHVFVHTGQHFDESMSKVFFDDLNLPEPDIYLGIGSGSHAKQTADIMLKLEPVILSEKPDLVVVVGDVNSTLAAALCAIKTKTPVAHVEAGYRSGDTSMPEEINRIVVDRISQMLFAPTKDSVDNLLKEGIERSRVFFVGNVMAETLIRFREKAKVQSILDNLVLVPKSYALATVHRAENVDSIERLKSIMDAFATSPIPVILPLHPRTEKELGREAIKRYVRAGVRITPPLGYLDFIRLLDNARFVLTDSGGVQEEALLLSVPCMTLRYNTERVITVKLGANRLVGANKRLIEEAIEHIMQDNTTTFIAPQFWDDRVAERIADIIIENNELLAVEPQGEFR